MSVALTDIIKRNEDLVFARMGDEVVMMSQDQSEYLGLNEVATVIWELVESPCSLSEVCDRLREQFEVSDEQCQAEVITFVKQMNDKGLIEVYSN